MGATVAESAQQPTRTGSPLLDRLWHAARSRGDSAPTADLLAAWARRFILFHDRRHPRELGLAQVTHFLEHVARTEHEPLPALAQARAALALLYEHVVGADLGELPWPRPPRVLDQFRLLLRLRHYSHATEDCYVQWARRFILFHRLRHPRTMGAAEVEQFLGHLAMEGRVSASTQNQAFNALVFFYRHVLEIDLGRLDAVRARRGKRLPVVLSPEEVRRVLDRITGANGLFSLMARLLYGCGVQATRDNHPRPESFFLRPFGRNENTATLAACRRTTAQRSERLAGRGAQRSPPEYGLTIPSHPGRVPARSSRGLLAPLPGCIRYVRPVFRGCSLRSTPG
jgi:hypothetical protein